MILPSHPDVRPETKGLKALGYWVNEHHPDLPDPKKYVDLSWDPAERNLVAQYLQKGKVVAAYRGFAPCRMCGVRNGSQCLSDGVYVWPSGFPHYLLEHGVRPPAEFVNHVLKQTGKAVQADLSPSLGKPGGPCQVVKRIVQEIQNRNLQDQLVDKVEQGEDLSNPEAAKVYDLEVERAQGIVTKMLIGPHTQYRMDLRKVGVKDVQKAFFEWSREVHALRKEGDPKYDALMDLLNRGEKVRYTSPQNLTVVFVGEQRGVVKLISTWWQGVPDPPPPGTCEVRAYSYDRRSGV